MGQKLLRESKSKSSILLFLLLDIEICHYNNLDNNMKAKMQSIKTLHQVKFANFFIYLGGSSNSNHMGILSSKSSNHVGQLSK